MDKCPRCGGSTVRDKDRYGSYVVCLMCGALGNLEPEVAPIDPSMYGRQAPGRGKRRNGRRHKGMVE